MPDTTFVTIPAAAGLNADSALDWLIDVGVFEQASSHTNWDTLSINASSLLTCAKTSSGAQNDEINFDLILARGTWDIELLFTKNTSYGIYSVQINSVEKGTIDGYDASNTFNNLSTISGVDIPQTAKYQLKLKMATKNASSSNYTGAVNHIQLRRTD